MNSSNFSSEQPANYNPPGLSTLIYRIGTHPTFFQRLLAGLPTQEISPNSNLPTPQHPLHILTTSHLDDPAIALLDAWAVVGDVLTFYQERIANEGYLRTATEDRSILELSRTVGYKLNPGVAASTYLTFTVEDTPGAAQEVTVPAGTEVQSIPKAPGELPQTFETIAQMKARVEWNSLKPDISPKFDLPKFEQNTNELLLQGTNTRLQPGDAILIISYEKVTDETVKANLKECRYFVTLQTVVPNVQKGYTQIEWDNKNKQILPELLLRKKEKGSSPPNVQVFAFRQQAFLFGYNAPQLNTQSDVPNPVDKNPGQGTSSSNASSSNTNVINMGTGTISSNAKISNANVIGQETAFNRELKAGDIITAANQSRIVTRVVSNNNLIVEMPFSPELLEQTGFTYSHRSAEWPLFGIRDKQIDLDALYPKISLGSWVLLSQPSSKVINLYNVNGVSVVFRSDLGLSGKITRIEADKNEELGKFDLRQTIVFAQSEKLELFAKPQTPLPVQGNTIEVESLIPQLETGRSLIISGNNPKKNKEDKIIYRSELAFIASTSTNIEQGRTILTLREPLQYDYDASTVEIRANVTLATHGETVEKEVLGSGNGGQANQRFKLKKPPLTYVSAATASGNQSTLQVYVNNVLWQEVSSLEEQDARSQCYIVQIDDRGECSIIFGDGIYGSRLPSGQENIIATYRSGIGQVGEVKAGSLILLQNRPLGIRDVTNLQEAAGAGDRETFLHIRDNVSRTVCTLDRIVSLRDFQNFTQSFSGIGKAQAVILWTGQTKLIHITISADHGQQVESNSALFTNLKQAIISNMSNPVQALEIQSYEPLDFNIEATVWIDPRYQQNNVRQRIENTLNQTFSFAKREFGQAVAASEVIEIIQNVEGVVAVNLDCLYLKSENKAKPIPSSIAAKTASWNASEKKALPSQLLLINPQDITLNKGS